MVNKPLDDIPKIVLEKDDVESFQRTRAQNLKTPGKNKDTTESAGVTSRGPSWLMLLLLLTVICGAAVYWSKQQYEVLNQAQQRITDLERRLSATGEEMDQSAVALQVKVAELTQKTNELWEQMDKLWASAWRRNQSDIADLTKVVTTNKGAAEGQLKQTSSQLTKLQESLQGLQTELAQQSTSQQLLQDTVADTKLAAQNNEQQLASMQEKLISSALGNNNLTNKVEDLNRQIKALEKRINALPTPATTTP
ncbi:MAG: hypothetical protein GW763_06980 [Paraglaciecola sp.]|nr:hypothetical protein [Paraglaciecola sp.]NCT47722.1 hypothetical protein [Paraglaciecola sp.]